jgi:hypothetical protein
MRNVICTSTFLIALFVLAASTPTLWAADVQFSATVDRTTVGITESFVLTLEIKGAGLSSADPKLPSLDHFAVISGPNQSTSFQFINGRASSSKTLSFVLKPQMVGNLSIGSAELTLSGKLYRTDPIAITVTAGAGQQPPGGLSQQTQPAPTTQPPALHIKANASDLFVEVTADKSQAYQGEQILLTYTLYTRLNVSSYEISKLPGTAGFWAEEFPSPAQPEVRDVTVGGQRYRAATIRRVALFPTRSGDLTVEPLEVSCQVQVMDRSRRSNDPFDMLFDSPFMRTRTEERFMATEPLILKILPLPESGRPANFSGAVGKFDLEVTLDPQEAKTNEALTMKVSYSGWGNIKMLPSPDFNAPPDFESYDPKESVQVGKAGRGISGTKTFEYVLIPRFAGLQKIPPITFSFFNPTTKSYQTLSGGGFEVRVGQGAGVSQMPASLGVSKEDVKLLGQDIQYLKTPGKLRPLATAGGLPGLYNLGMILPPLIVLLYLIGTRLMGGSVFQARLRSRRAFWRAQNDLKKLDKVAAGSSAEKLTVFYGGLHRTLLEYLGEKLNIPAAGLKEEEVLDHLAGRDLPAAQVEEIREIFHTCNWARFAPESGQASQMDQALTKARAVINTLEASGEKSI